MLGFVSVVDVAVWFGTLSPMPRTMRVKYPGAIYHVMDRGDRREHIVVRSLNSNLRTPFRITAAKLRLRVTQAPVAPALSDFGLFLEPE